MREKADLIRGWLRKARSDEVALSASLSAGALDAACFHAQQAAEKCLKAYLTHVGVTFPFTHNLAKLVELCAASDASFLRLNAAAQTLTPYAVELRYDDEFWPSAEVAQEAKSLAQTIHEFVESRIPRAILDGP